MADFLKDRMSSGLLVGLVTVPVLYFCLRWIFSVSQGNNSSMMLGNKLPLIVLAFNIILFRFISVNRKEFETGKGLLLVIFFTAMLYLMNEKYHLLPL